MDLYGFFSRFFKTVGLVRGRQLAQPHDVSPHAKGKAKAKGWWAKRKKRRQMTRASRRINRKR